MFIPDVKTKKLRIIPDERGFLMEVLRNDDKEFFKEFGQVYVSGVYKDVVKAWHYHKEQTDNVCCVSGMIKLVIYDSRKESETYGEIQELFIGNQNPMLVQIPPRCYHGWKGMSELSLVVNCSDKMYNYTKPDEFRLDPHSEEIPYEWKRKDG